MLKNIFCWFKLINLHSMPPETTENNHNNNDDMPLLQLNQTAQPTRCRAGQQ